MAGQARRCRRGKAGVIVDAYTGVPTVEEIGKADPWVEGDEDRDITDNERPDPLKTLDQSFSTEEIQRQANRVPAGVLLDHQRRLRWQDTVLEAARSDVISQPVAHSAGGFGLLACVRSGHRLCHSSSVVMTHFQAAT